MMGNIDLSPWAGALKAWVASFLVSGGLFLGLTLAKRHLLKTLFQRKQLHALTHKATESDLKNYSKFHFDELVTKLLKDTKLFFFFSWAVFVGISFHTVPSHIVLYSQKTIFLITMLQLGIWTSAVVGYLIERSMRNRVAKDAAQVTTISLITSLAKLVVYGTLCLLALNNFGVDITALVAGLGIGGIAVALAVQNILGDVFASLTIVLDKPFVIGDLIVVEDFTGYVERIGLKTTLLRSLTGELLIFPNGDLLKSRIRNFRRMEERRVSFSIQVIYQTPHAKLEKIPKIIKNILYKQRLARLERSNFKSFGTFGLVFETVYWVLDREMNVYMNVQETINLEVYQQLKAEGIEFAYLNQIPPTREAFPTDILDVATVE